MDLTMQLIYRSSIKLRGTKPSCTQRSEKIMIYSKTIIVLKVEVKRKLQRKKVSKLEVGQICKLRNNTLTIFKWLFRKFPRLKMSSEMTVLFQCISRLYHRRPQYFLSLWCPLLFQLYYSIPGPKEMSNNSVY